MTELVLNCLWKEGTFQPKPLGLCKGGRTIFLLGGWSTPQDPLVWLQFPQNVCIVWPFSAQHSWQWLPETTSPREDLFLPHGFSLSQQGRHGRVRGHRNKRQRRLMSWRTRKQSMIGTKDLISPSKACFGNLFLPAGPLKIVPELEHRN